MNIIWNNKDILIDDKIVFHRNYFVKEIKYTTDLLFDITNIESFNIIILSGCRVL